MNIKDITKTLEYDVTFSVCTLVNNSEQYESMLDSFKKCGFDSDDVEFLKIDNTKSNNYDGYGGIRKFLLSARGKYIVICHQDILLMHDGKNELQKRLEELEGLDKNWAICGNAGCRSIYKDRVIRISDRHGSDACNGPFPKRVQTLDENLLIIKKESLVSTSFDISGYHLYGSDICLMADILGYSCYVIDWHIKHLGQGICDDRFYKLQDMFVKRYAHKLRPRFVETTCTRFVLTGLWGSLLNSFVFLQIVKRFHQLTKYRNAK